MYSNRQTFQNQDPKNKNKINSPIPFKVYCTLRKIRAHPSQQKRLTTARGTYVSTLKIKNIVKGWAVIRGIRVSVKRP